jgi:prevent-host-death family protein
MGHAVRVRNLRGELVESPEVSASDAKNVGRILDYVATAGGVTITRRRTPLAVVIPIETYTRLLAAEENALGTLTSEFDALLARMQQPGMSEAMERAFAMSPAQLGAAAAAQARSPRPTREHKRGKRKQPRAK